jgi:hypothetical protein
MLNSYQDFFQPSKPVELDLVSDMVAARWAPAPTAAQ